MKAGQSKHLHIEFDGFDIAQYKGFTVERLRRRQGNKKIWHYRIVGRPTKFTSLDAVLEEADYLAERRKRLARIG